MSEDAMTCAQLQEERNWAVYAEVFGLFAKHFPTGIVIDTSKGGECPQLRCGPFKDRRGAWAIVRYADGRREIIDVRDDKECPQIFMQAHVADARCATSA